VTGIPEPTAKTDEANVSERTLSEKEQKGVEDFYWAREAPEVQQHQGKLVVVHNKRVVAVGTDRQVLVTEVAARENCEPEDLVVLVVPRVSLAEIPH
jgi:hypothetical protein